MPTTNISVARYYGNSKYYGFMPLAIFNALECAFMNCQPTAAVDRAAFRSMLTNYNAARR